MTWHDDLERTPPTETPLQLRARLQATFSPTELSVAISTLPVSWLVAIVAALDVVAARDKRIRDAGYPGGEQYRQNHIGGPSELQRRRYPPHGDVAEWIEFGPAGRPAEGGAAAA